MSSPNYKKIYTDLIVKKFPEKKKFCKDILVKKKLSTLDIIELNEIIFGNKNKPSNQQLRSYSKEDIFKILDYQKKHNLNNTQLSKKFSLSRNTITKWKKIFL
ncbi:helix-turn-helix domain-containing protein [Empedobacter falsenii]